MGNGRWPRSRRQSSSRRRPDRRRGRNRCGNDDQCVRDLGRQRRQGDRVGGRLDDVRGHDYRARRRAGRQWRIRRGVGQADAGLYAARRHHARRTAVRTLLLDPANFTIGFVDGPNQISNKTLQNQLAVQDVILATNNATGTDPGDILVNSNVTWSSSRKLTLNAFHDIVFGINVDMSNTAPAILCCVLTAPALAMVARLS